MGLANVIYVTSGLEEVLVKGQLSGFQRSTIRWCWAENFHVRIW